MRLPRPPLLAILEPAAGLQSRAAALIAGGLRWLSLRAKHLPGSEQITLALSLKPLAAAAGACLALHGDPALAAAAGLTAVHLSRDGNPAAARAQLGERALIGLSAHDALEARRAASLGADYVTLSPVFPSSSKPGHAPAVPLAGLREIAAALPIPVVALGGVTPQRIAACLAAGAAGIAVLGPFAAPADPAAAAEAYRSMLGG